MRVRYPWVALLLTACNNPLSNEVFYADETFLAVFPDTERIGFSDAFASYPRNTDDPILLAAVAEAEEIEPTLKLMIGISDLLRNTEPTDRSNTHRRWAPRSVAAPPEASIDLWYLRADIARSGADSDYSWQIEGSREEAGEYALIGWGTHTPDGEGELSWDLPATAALFGLQVGPALLEASYSGATDRHTEIAVQTTTITQAQYSFDGQSFFGWVGSVDVDGTPQVGAGQVYIRPDGAGRGIVVVYPEGVEEVQESCWGLAGQSEYTTGSLLHERGVETDCLVEDVF